MSNENALFDDDFEDVFSEDSMSDHTPSDIDLNEVDDSVDQAVAEGAPMSARKHAACWKSARKTDVWAGLRSNASPAAFPRPLRI